ncbi:hypothetical protein E8E15_008501 [Penicillium rubens]|uniref:Uncharacterized protein n=1 Tax=Penicillium chrysogenum TaxID=5076 RepID=A0A167TZB0_PENCH|nr:uncharacterized protein N7525_007655 [Penicillium rubens]XP_056571358.1 uncharacterized protein N7489_001301 [Penicillium chrysogenum]KAF3027756.1 hypothetical protein E8E15_008501 [Penicillium rubens]KAJ5049127.1 hypothetical protein NUH16_007640 [Penicillium rubens]KAJ5250891.1 hypothetical protein N7489_001301 [Penicillium chrysogenum]KAJ5269790.1 hypothetical protein N7505_005548 [Penicillium chrysogenum]KAJ5829402.1 hypothetical protein N7525_007655 [Penicillium rubens]
MPNDNPACADCKAKKKRCIHRIQPVKVAEASAIRASMSSPPAPAAVPTPAATPAPVEAPGAATRGRRKAAEAKSKEMSPAPADSSDALSSVPSEPEQKPVVKKPTKRTPRAKSTAAVSQEVSQEAAPNFPDDGLHAASTMSVNQVFANKLHDKLRELQERMRTFDEALRDVMAGNLQVPQESVESLDEAHRDVQASSQTIQNTVEGWIQCWARSGR